MPQDKLALAKKLIGEGMDRHDSLRRFIALGVSTEDFQDMYSKALTDLGMPEPKSAMPDLVTGEMSLKSIKHKSPIIMMLMAGVAVVFFFAGMYFILTENIPAKILDLLPTGSHNQTNTQFQTSSESPSFSDAVLKKKIDSTMASVRIYKSRMLDYQGVCSDIAVVAPIMCKEMTASVVVYAKDSKGTTYCVDGTGKSGTSVIQSETSISCK